MTTKDKNIEISAAAGECICEFRRELTIASKTKVGWTTGNR
jgi:hypothetical protein